MATTTCWPLKMVPSSSSAQICRCASERLISSSSFFRLASMKRSLMVLFSSPYASVNCHSVSVYSRMLSPRMRLLHTVFSAGDTRWNNW